MPAQKLLVERHRDDPFQLIGINEGDDAEAFREGMREHGLTWLIGWQGHQSGPGANSAITKLYRVQYFPTVYVIDAEGVIRHKDLRGAALDRAVEKLLAEMAEGAENDAEDEPDSQDETPPGP
ncbi:hypothetical protein Pla163_31500 [Planctomycetes bacterium Pla163]|uniref:TlpA family protein disulfide reductase n=1 Tax=Rohdeia mirabilis TaxID=2528008 RepID=A0A518D3F0_9BACT|nr:hypothetical protein Pla163_31500 [Planctomycetes bacterium Pla163]